MVGGAVWISQTLNCDMVLNYTVAVYRTYIVISQCPDLSYYQWTLCAPLAASNAVVPCTFCVTGAPSSNPTFSTAGKSHTPTLPQEGDTVPELDIVIDTILVEMYHNIAPDSDSDVADKVATTVGQIVKKNLCEDQSNV